MRLKLPAGLVDWLIRNAEQNPYLHLPGYMERFWLIKPRAWLPFSVRLHHILRSDVDRHFHDHPWPNLSLILRGGYVEHMPITQAQPPEFDQKPQCTVMVTRNRGCLVRRTATHRHKLILPKGCTCWSLFVMWGKQRDWGFYTPTGWVYWREYLNDWTTETATDKTGGKP